MSDEFVLRISLQNWSKEELVLMMRRQLREGQSAKSCKGKIDRYVVNMLRHRHSNYDRRQTSENFMKVCSAISERYGWLSAECTRQMEHRERKVNSFVTTIAA